MRTSHDPPPRPSRSPVRYAVVGAGHTSRSAFMPAFERAPGSELVALVSGDELARAELPGRLDLPRVVGHDQYDELLASGDVDAVYVALPSWMHAEYAIRAARHGVHVLCEEPMAVDEHECERMLRAADEGGVRLGIADRLRFDPAGLDAIRRVQAGEIGDPRVFTSTFTLDVDPDDIRLAPPVRGGGPVYELGIRCISAARNLFRQEPRVVAAVAGSRDDPRFSRTPETVAVTLAFEGGRIASFVTSFCGDSTSRFTLVGSRGRLVMEPAYDPTRRPELVVEAEGQRRVCSYPEHDRLAAQLVDFSDCITTGRTPEPDGREGLADVRIIQAIHESIAHGGGPIRLLPIDSGPRLEPWPAIVRPPPDEGPPEIRTSSPRRREAPPPPAPAR